jgi:predicted house-cleaning noncanonical NTP pyrophosphatase (MazG superfamily)
MKHNKLVRDRIPEIIAEHGERPVTRTLDAENFRRELKKKLQEEVAEFCASESPEELADILEVVYALASASGISQGQLDELRERKLHERGGFWQRVFLVETCSSSE